MNSTYVKAARLSKTNFSDNLTGAYCKLFEERKPDGSISITVEWRVADSTEICGAYFNGSDWEKAWFRYRQELGLVLDSIQKWDAI